LLVVVQVQFSFQFLLSGESVFFGFVSFVSFVSFVKPSGLVNNSLQPSPDLDLPFAIGLLGLQLLSRGSLSISSSSSSLSISSSSSISSILRFRRVDKSAIGIHSIINISEG